MISNFALTMLAGCVAAQQVIVTDSTTSINKFGNMVVETIFEDLIQKVITKPIVPFAKDYAQQTKHIENLTKLASRLNNHFQSNDQPIWTCEDRTPGDFTDPYDFFPIYLADIGPGRPKAHFTGRCFDFDVEYVPTGDFTFDVNVTTSNPKTLLCKDFLFFANTELHHFDTFFMHGDHKFSFDMTGDSDAQIDFAFGGMQIF